MHSMDSRLQTCPAEPSGAEKDYLWAATFCVHQVEAGGQSPRRFLSGNSKYFDFVDGNPNWQFSSKNLNKLCSLFILLAEQNAQPNMLISLTGAVHKTPRFSQEVQRRSPLFTSTRKLCTLALHQSCRTDNWYCIFPTCPPVHLFISPPVHLLICPLVHLSTFPPVHMSTCPPVYQCILPPLHLLTCPPVHLSTWLMT